MRLSKFFALLLLSSPLGLNATTALGAESERGMLDIQIKDHRKAIGDFSKAKILIDKILLSPKPELKF